MMYLLFLFHLLDPVSAIQQNTEFKTSLKTLKIDYDTETIYIFPIYRKENRSETSIVRHIERHAFAVAMSLSKTRMKNFTIVVTPVLTSVYPGYRTKLQQKLQRSWKFELQDIQEFFSDNFNLRVEDLNRNQINNFAYIDEKCHFLCKKTLMLPNEIK